MSQTFEHVPLIKIQTFEATSTRNRRLRVAATLPSRLKKKTARPNSHANLILNNDTSTVGIIQFFFRALNVSSPSHAPERLGSRQLGHSDCKDSGIFIVLIRTLIDIGLRLKLESKTIVVVQMSLIGRALGGGNSSGCAEWLPECFVNPKILTWEWIVHSHS